MYGNCCGPGYGARRYYTRKERKELLEEYATALESELKGVRERIKDVGSDEE